MGKEQIIRIMIFYFFLYIFACHGSFVKLAIVGLRSCFLFFVILIVFKTLSIHFDFGFFMCEGHAPG